MDDGAQWWKNLRKEFRRGIPDFSAIDINTRFLEVNNLSSPKYRTPMRLDQIETLVWEGGDHLTLHVKKIAFEKEKTYCLIYHCNLKGILNGEVVSMVARQDYQRDFDLEDRPCGELRSQTLRLDSEKYWFLANAESSSG